MDFHVSLFFLILLFFGVIHCVFLSKGLIFLTSLSPGSLFFHFFFLSGRSLPQVKVADGGTYICEKCNLRCKFTHLLGI